MSRESTTKMSPSAERLAEATLGSWEAVADAAVWQQGSAARFTLGWIEMLKEQAETNLRLADLPIIGRARTVGAWRSRTTTSASKRGARGWRENSTSLRSSNSRLTSKRRNRASLLKRLDRTLV